MSILDDMFQTYASPAAEHWFGVKIKLKRGTRETPDVPATWMKPPEEQDFEGLPLRITHRVYRIRVDAYVLDAKVVEPVNGDILIETIGGTATRFQVLPTDSMPAVERDGDGTHWIIRTKKI
jgi:hypothetical protein